MVFGNVNKIDLKILTAEMLKPKYGSTSKVEGDTVNIIVVGSSPTFPAVATDE